MNHQEINEFRKSLKTVKKFAHKKIPFVNNVNKETNKFSEIEHFVGVSKPKDAKKSSQHHLKQQDDGGELENHLFHG